MSDVNDQPIPLTQAVEIPRFPVDALPQRFADMAGAVAEATQTDPAMAATSLLSVLSACTGGRAEIEIRAGWLEPLNLYTATIAAPGERKSAVQLAMVAPIFDVEATLAAAGAAASQEAETRKQVALKAAERQRNAAASADPAKMATALSDAISASSFAEGISVPAIPRLVADDVTPEAAASLLAEQGGRLAILSAEGGIFDIIAGRYSRAVNLDLWLKAHSGDPLKVDRKGRPPEYIRRPTLTLGLMIQPAVLSTIAANREFRGRGFLARILYSYPMSKVGHRRIGAQPVSDQIRHTYSAALADLAAGLAGRSAEPTVLTLTPTAQAEMESLEEAVEPTLAGDGELASLADWGAKYVGAVARIAGILHLAENGAGKGPSELVTDVTVKAAKRIGAYFKACAITAFAEMGTDQATADAVYLLSRVRHLSQGEVSERELQRAGKRFKTKAELRPALDRLVDHGYLTLIQVAESTGGRPASPRYKVTEETKATKGPDRRAA